MTAEAMDRQAVAAWLRGQRWVVVRALMDSFGIRDATDNVIEALVVAVLSPPVEDAFVAAVLTPPVEEDDVR